MDERDERDAPGAGLTPSDAAAHQAPDDTALETPDDTALETPDDTALETPDDTALEAPDDAALDPTRAPADESALALRQRICETVDRIQALEEEYAALWEVRDSLTATRRDLQRQIDVSAAELRSVEGELAAAGGRLEGVEAELATTRTEMSVLERRCRRMELSARDLDEAVEALERELESDHHEQEVAESVLAEVGESIRRIDHKLAFHDRKWTARDKVNG